MKTTFIVGFLAMSSLSFAQVEKNVARSFDSLLSDTVNEGDVNARVKEVTCELSNYREAGKKIANCDLTLKVRSELTGETQTCEQECSIAHIVDGTTFSVISRKKSQEMDCLENLASGCE